MLPRLQYYSVAILQTCLVLYNEAIVILVPLNLDNEHTSCSVLVSCGPRPLPASILCNTGKGQPRETCSVNVLLQPPLHCCVPFISRELAADVLIIDVPKHAILMAHIIA